MGMPRLAEVVELFARGSSDAASGYQYCSNLFCLLLYTQKTGLKYQIANFTLPQVNSKTHKRNARELLFTCAVRAKCVAQTSSGDVASCAIQLTAPTTNVYITCVVSRVRSTLYDFSTMETIQPSPSQTEMDSLRKGEARVSCLGGLEPRAWRARERELITGVWGLRPQRGLVAEPLVRGAGGGQAP